MKFISKVKILSGSGLGAVPAADLYGCGATGLRRLFLTVLTGVYTCVATDVRIADALSG